MKRVTLNVLAKEAGVSKTTASLILNGKADSVNIAQSTQKRVKELAQKLNYRPGRFSPGRLNGKTGIIILMVKDFSIHGNSIWLNHLILKAETFGYTIIPQLLNKDTSSQRSSDLPADACIFLNEDAVPAKTEIISNDIPVIGAGFFTNIKGIKCFAPNYTEQINELIIKLYRLNKKAIGYLGEKGNNAGQQRKRETYTENYCDRFEIAENMVFLKNRNPLPEELKDGCESIIAKGANGIIFETPELATAALSIQQIREHAKNGIVFACCGDPGISGFLDKGSFITSSDQTEELSTMIIEYIEK